MEIEDLTLQLRRAYRLVHGYQRSIVDLSREIGTRLGLEFFGWEPAFYGLPSRFKTDISRKWSWDLLPAYSIYLAFTTPGPVERGSYMLVLWFEADSGFSKLYDETKRGEPDFTKMDAPEQCSTKVYFWHSVIKDDRKIKDSQTFWDKLWNTDWPEDPSFEFEMEGTKLKGQMMPCGLGELGNTEKLSRRLDELKATISKIA